MTKPKGIHASFQTTCWRCEGELTVTNGNLAPHDCRHQRIKDLDEPEQEND